MRYRNAMQRDPNLARAFDNLAGMFAPPSGSDFLASAKMQSERADAARLAEIYNYAKDPSFNRELFERKAIAAGRYNPNQSFYSVDQSNLTLRNNNAADNTRQLEQERIRGQNAVTLEQAKPVIVSQDQNAFIPSATQAVTGFGPMLRGKMEFDANKTYLMPDGTTGAGPSMPSVDQAKAAAMERARAAGQVTDQQIIDNVLDKTVQARGSDGRDRFVAPGTAVREEMSPIPTTPVVGTFVAPGPDGKPVPFNGRVGPDGRIINTDTGQVVPNAIKYERSSATSLEVNKDGTISFRQGNVGGQTNSRQTDLARASDDNTRTSNEMVSLLRTIRPDDIGFVGNLNQLATNYGAQVFPSLARPDVSGRRTQLETTILGSARALAQDDRLSDGDRKAVEKIVASTGVGESFEGVQAKLATLAVITAYRAAYADSVREGQRLPDLNSATLGKLIDDKRIPADVALMYQQNVLSGRGVTGGPVPGVQVPPGLPGAPGAPQAAAPPAAQGSQPVRVKTVEEASRLPSGTPIILPDGSPGRVP